MLDYISAVLQNMPSDWLELTTHRLDIYDEKRAKTQFLEQFEALYQNNNADPSALAALPTAYDYIRLGHPLSSILEWVIAQEQGLAASAVISFASQTMPILAILRSNLLQQKNTEIVYSNALPSCLDLALLRKVYGYQFELRQMKEGEELPPFEGSRVLLTKNFALNKSMATSIDFLVNFYDSLGAVLLVNGKENEAYIPEIQHVRRRETIAMTPINCFQVLEAWLGAVPQTPASSYAQDKSSVLQNIKNITAVEHEALLASSGLSMQYAIMMGLVDHALEHYPNKAIKILVPPNCYGGTNDQARRLAAAIDAVEVMDLPVDGEHNMEQSIDLVLDQVVQEDAVPYIIAEIPTNPRVEVPDLEQLKSVLTKQRSTSNGAQAVAPVFILDQTFCPNVQFLKEGGVFSNIATIAYVSGSKFPSAGKCTAAYTVLNRKALQLKAKIEAHLKLCNNEATALQVSILAEQLPSMNQRIQAAYQNTRSFVNFIQKQLPTAKINFVSEELANQGFTPSVFSLDLPSKGDTAAAREAYKRALNEKLIHLMITKIPDESKYCVSYGQLKGCYWTIPATSTQGTTKEADKDYIARVSVSPNFDLERHQAVFLEFLKEL